MSDLIHSKQTSFKKKTTWFIKHIHAFFFSFFVGSRHDINNPKQYLKKK